MATIANVSDGASDADSSTGHAARMCRPCSPRAARAVVTTRYVRCRGKGRGAVSGRSTGDSFADGDAAKRGGGPRSHAAHVTAPRPHRQIERGAPDEHRALHDAATRGPHAVECEGNAGDLQEAAVGVGPLSHGRLDRLQEHRPCHAQHDRVLRGRQEI